MSCGAYAPLTDYNPNDANILIKSGLYRSYFGDHDAGLIDVDLAMKRNPLHPDWYWRERGIVLFGLGAYEEALHALQLCENDHILDHVYQASCMSAIGERNDARERIERLRRIDPEICFAKIESTLPLRCYRKQEDKNRLRDLLAFSDLH
jgi:adenylate cyclase